MCAASFSPDGRTVVTASDDKTARLWDAASGKELQRLTHDDGVHAASFSPDGRTVVTASKDKTARLWDAASGKELQRLPHDGLVCGGVVQPRRPHRPHRQRATRPPGCGTSVSCPCPMTWTRTVCEPGCWCVPARTSRRKGRCAPEQGRMGTATADARSQGRRLAAAPRPAAVASRPGGRSRGPPGLVRRPLPPQPPASDRSEQCGSPPSSRRGGGALESSLTPETVLPDPFNCCQPASIFAWLPSTGRLGGLAAWRTWRQGQRRAAIGTVRRSWAARQPLADWRTTPHSLVISTSSGWTWPPGSPRGCPVLPAMDL